MDIGEMYFSSPLYEKIKPDEFSLSALEDLVQQIKDKQIIDLFCIECNKESTFKGEEITLFVGEDPLLRVFGMRFTCLRDSSHEAFVYFLVGESYIMKIGQYPSVADIKIREGKPFSRILPSELRAELHRAIGLAAHGVGVGSFVYLRRVFESLILETYEKEYLQDEDVDDKKSFEEFLQMRMEERVALLKRYLPEYLVENRKVYAILSKGIHELSEQECLDYFEVVRASIELMLQERTYLIEQRRTKQRIKQELSRLYKEME